MIDPLPHLVRPEQFADWIRLAQDNCIDAAKVLLREGTAYYQRGQVPPEPLCSYLAEAMLQIAESGVDANAAFNLKRGRGTNKYKALMKQHLICFEVEFAKRKLGKYTAAGGDGAFSVVASAYDYSDPDNVRKVFDQRKPVWRVKDRPEKELRDMILLFRRFLGYNPDTTAVDECGDKM